MKAKDLAGDIPRRRVEPHPSRRDEHLPATSVYAVGPGQPEVGRRVGRGRLGHGAQDLRRFLPCLQRSPSRSRQPLGHPQPQPQPAADRRRSSGRRRPLRSRPLPPVRGRSSGRSGTAGERRSLAPAAPGNRQFRSAIVMAVGIDAWPDGCACVSELVIDVPGPAPDQPPRSRRTGVGKQRRISWRARSAPSAQPEHRVSFSTGSGRRPCSVNRVSSGGSRSLRPKETFRCSSSTCS